jgi:hypothetical protein
VLRRLRRLGRIALAIVIGAVPRAAAAQAPVEGAARAARANAPAPARARSPVAARAPSSPPLAGPAAGQPAGEEGSAGAGEGELDPLVSNGLGSPTCNRASHGELSATSRSHCETSGFVASAAPTGNYGIDVHIDKGVLGLSDGGLMSAVQDLFVTPLWMAMVWAVHALVVMLEWCFTVDLLAGAAAGGLGSGLRQMESGFTEPWLPLALAVASILALYHGLIRRRVAETLGQVALMAAMMAGGLWVILDPTGTVGDLGQWADQAALGTLATAAQGSPDRPERTLGADLEAVFTAAVQAPWCYLEFGDVGWCRDTARLDPRLERAALRIAAIEQSLIGCKISPLVACATAGSAAARVLQHSAALLRDARSNGAIFLALPANGPARNSINDDGSLLWAICQASTATSCSGPSAAQAQFRTNNSTWSRVGGLMLIGVGLLGLLLLLGFLALRLLTAAIFSLLYLLLAPAMILAPAFGDAGRTLFCRWGAQLLGTVLAKLVYSFLLGVVLAVVAVVVSLSAIGWWTQWLLMSALWWGAFARRHQPLGASGGSDSGLRRSVTRRLAMREARRAIADRRRAKGRDKKEAPAVGPRPYTDAERPRPASLASDAAPQAPGTSEPRAGMREPENGLDRPIADRRAQLERIHQARDEAQLAGQDRRATELAVRGERVRGEIEELLGASRERAPAGDAGGTQAGPGMSRAVAADQGDAHSRDRGSPQPRGSGAPSARGRHHEPPPEVAGYQREEHRRPDAKGRRAARLEIDRALAQREELRRAGPGSSPAVSRPPGGGGGERRPRQPRDRSAGAGEPRERAPESIVMREAREVEAGRKRQLGRDQP